jgi:hypothetical protein
MLRVVRPEAGEEREAFFDLLHHVCFIMYASSCMNEAGNDPRIPSLGIILRNKPFTS